jgi:ubiquinone/menaquinone biosynthesis C-methylase UbiE
MSLKSENKIAFNRTSNEFEQLYIDLRSYEKRVYTDEEVAWLPDVNENHIHRKEWEIRKTSCKKLIRYLRQKKRSLKILEVGCGNGWLSYQLSQIRYSNVIGVDVNLLELQQAERVFADIPNLNFIYGDLNSTFLEFEKFDIVIFAASIQYFNSFSEVIETVLDKLNQRGEIHIMDSHFYSEEEVGRAEERSRDYFLNKGFGKMYEFYFHHSLKELGKFNFAILYDPHSALNKILRNKNPFYWIGIKK